MYAKLVLRVVSKGCYCTILLIKQFQVTWNWMAALILCKHEIKTTLLRTGQAVTYGTSHVSLSQRERCEDRQNLIKEIR